MKKAIYILLAIILLSNIVYSGEVKHLELSDENNFVVLNERDAFDFYYNNIKNIVMIKKVQDDQKVDITFFIDIESEKTNSDTNVPYYFTLFKDVHAQVDINKDLEPDILLELTNVNDKEVTLLIKLFDSQENPATGATIEELENSKSISISNILTIVLGLVVLILFYLLIKKRK